MKHLMRDLRWILPVSLGAGLLLSLLDGRGQWWIGWLAAALLLFLGLTALAALWRSAGAGRGLGLILLVALGLRLLVGIGLTHVLPAYGHGTEVEQAGYVFKDAYFRDYQAWELASSTTPLWEAFSKSYSNDQYGGLLALSAGIYRLLSPDIQRPWLILILAALTATIGIAIAWKAVWDLTGERLANPVAWILALYPEAILLASSQMREPFLMTFISMAFGGLVNWQMGHPRRAWGWLAGGLVGLLLFHPGVAVLTLVGLGGWTWLWSGHVRIRWWSALIGLGIGAIALVLLWLGLASGPFAGKSMLVVLTNWLQASTRWDTYLLQEGSGTVKAVFNILPKSLHIPFATAYGMTQPVLPAAVADPTVWPWKVIGILRAAGWYLLAPFLLAGLISTWKTLKHSQRRAWIWLWLVCWGWILLSSLRAGGDQWDNPRYRVIFLLWQAMLAAQAWVWWRSTGNAWMARLLAVEGIFLAFFTYWYVARYAGWTHGQLDLIVIILAVAVLAAVVLLGGWLFERFHASARRSKEE